MQAARGTSLSDSGREADRDRRTRGRSALLVFALVAAGTYLLDQGTKYVATRQLEPDRPRRLLDGVLELNLSRNAGAAFSTGRGYTVVLSLLALCIVAVILRVARDLRSAWWAVTMGLILGGALGNVSDRLFREPGPFRGHVVDFIELPHWPIFNVADMAICGAAALFVVLSLRGVRLAGSAAL
jgi:signal peptidase II